MNRVLDVVFAWLRKATDGLVQERWTGVES